MNSVVQGLNLIFCNECRLMFLFREITNSILCFERNVDIKETVGSTEFERLQ